MSALFLPNARTTHKDTTKSSTAISPMPPASSPSFPRGLIDQNHQVCAATCPPHPPGNHNVSGTIEAKTTLIPPSPLPATLPPHHKMRTAHSTWKFPRPYHAPPPSLPPSCVSSVISVLCADGAVLARFINFFEASALALWTRTLRLFVRGVAEVERTLFAHRRDYKQQR